MHNKTETENIIQRVKRLRHMRLLSPQVSTLDEQRGNIETSQST